jgi:hypothetical protein
MNETFPPEHSFVRSYSIVLLVVAGRFFCSSCLLLGPGSYVVGRFCSVRSDTAQTFHLSNIFAQINRQTTGHFY